MFDKIVHVVDGGACDTIFTVELSTLLDFRRRSPRESPDETLRACQCMITGRKERKPFRLFANMPATNGLPFRKIAMKCNTHSGYLFILLHFSSFRVWSFACIAWSSSPAAINQFVEWPMAIGSHVLARDIKYVNRKGKQDEEKTVAKR